MLRPSGSSPRARAGATLPGKAWEWTCLHGLSSQPRVTYVIPRSAELEPALNWPVWSPFCHRRSRGTRHAAHPHHGERKWHARALRQPAAHGEDARKATAAAGARRGPRRHPRRRGRGRARRPGAPDAVALQGLLRRLGRVAVQVLEAEPEEKTPPRRAAAVATRRWRSTPRTSRRSGGRTRGGRGGHDLGCREVSYPADLVAFLRDRRREVPERGRGGRRQDRRNARGRSCGP